MWELELFATQRRSDLAFFLSDINILAIYRVSKWDPLVSQIEAASHVCQKKDHIKLWTYRFDRYYCWIYRKFNAARVDMAINSTNHA